MCQRYPAAAPRHHWIANKSLPSQAKLADLLCITSTCSVFELVTRFNEANYLTGMAAG